MRRAFSLVEVMVVVAVIGIAGTLAVQGIAAQVRGARAASERTAVALDLRTQKRHASERLHGMLLQVEGDHTLRFLGANVVRDDDGAATGCSLSGGGGGGGGINGDALAPITTPTVLAERTYPSVSLRVIGTFCLDEVGRPVDGDARLVVDADTNGDGAVDTGERGFLAYSAAGVLQGSGALAAAKAVSASNGAVAGEVSTLSKQTTLQPPSVNAP